MTKLLYLTSSSYSGSTLFTFLANQHPQLVSIGELEGWDYGADEYYCSCGALIEACPFFSYVASEYSKNNLAFDTRNFGTKLRFSNNDKLNRYLTSALPYIQSGVVEKVRDSLLRHTPGMAKKLKNALDSNKVFIDAALRYSNADVFLDATKNPFRIRMLGRIKGLELSILYLVRDIRGVVASNVRKKDVQPAVAASQWLTDQENILRVLSEFPEVMRLYYEDLCSDANQELGRIYEALRIDPFRFTGDIRLGEHHILGNVMRVSDVSEIRKDERWKSELDREQIREVEGIAQQYLETGGSQDVKQVIKHYLGNI